jgi:hypothetical protein
MVATQMSQIKEEGREGEACGEERGRKREACTGE